MKNFLGTIRIYSLLDFVLLLFAIGLSNQKIIGFTILHLGFLFFLEYQHKHSYRGIHSPYLWITLFILGTLISGEYIVSILFIFFSFLYAQKNKSKWGLISPIIRGLQNYTIPAVILGWTSYMAIIVFFVFFVRNLCGDIRDSGKDGREGMHTIPLFLGLKRNVPYLHLFTVMLTSTLWWSLTELHIGILLTVLVLQILTYNITRR
ncbi:MAG: hypothetical protein MRY49_01475 [Candidatus Pacebacteria bacterium]|nr:hypothetical protein [Candidatus Paceibacterota bacterium]